MSMDLGLRNKVALVQAGGGGLGGAIAATLARQGCIVAVCDISLASAEATASAIRSEGGRAMAHHWDLARPEAFEEWLRVVETAVGSVDILINNTGGPPPASITDVAMDDWRAWFDQMVLSVVRMTNLVLPQMRLRRWGRILTSTSSGVITPIADLGLSNTLRSALLGWSKTLAREVAADGITCNVLVPGRFATKRVTRLDETRAARSNLPLNDVVGRSTSTIPVGRYGQPQEYADVAAFLVSARNAYMTGSLVRVDGGLIPSH